MRPPSIPWASQAAKPHIEFPESASDGTFLEEFARSLSELLSRQGPCNLTTSARTVALLGSDGIAHVGIIRAIQEAGLSVDMVAGTSMGAIVGTVEKGSPSGWKIASLILFYMSLYKLCNLTPMAGKIRWRIIRRSNNRLLRWVTDEGMCTHMAIFKNLEVRSYPGRIIYIQPEKSWIRSLNLTRIGRSWLKVARGGIESYRTPGTHHTLLQRGNVEFVAAILNDCLERSGADRPTPPPGQP